MLELIAKLIEKNKGVLKEVLPVIDHGRVAKFVTLWKDYADRPAWLDSVITTLS